MNGLLTIKTFPFLLNFHVLDLAKYAIET